MIYMAALGGGENNSTSFTSIALFWRRPGPSLCSSLLRTTRAIYLENFSSKDNRLAWLVRWVARCTFFAPFSLF